MLTGHYTWGLGVKVGLPIAIVAILLLVVLALVCVFAATDYDGELRAGAWTFSLTALGVAVATILFLVPWAQPFHQYHGWNEVEGTVATVDSRLVGANDSTTQRFVVTFQESDTIFGCDDSRCSTIKPGKKLRLLCMREWEYQAVSGWGCRYGQES